MHSNRVQHPNNDFSNGNDDLADFVGGGSPLDTVVMEMVALETVVLVLQQSREDVLHAGEVGVVLVVWGEAGEGGHRCLPVVEDQLHSFINQPVRGGDSNLLQLAEETSL